MEKQKLVLIALAVFSITILLAQDNLPLVFAVSVASVTFPAGTTTNDVAYDKSTQGQNSSTAYVVGQNAGQAYVWKKSATTQTILFNTTLTGSGTASAVEYNPDIQSVYIATNDKFRRMSTNLALQVQLASGIAATTIELFYDNTNNVMYFCTNDTYGTINTSTLSPLTLYTDVGVNSIFGCAFDIADNVVYLTGDTIGGGFDIVKVSLLTHTVITGVNIGVDFLYGVCVDDVMHKIWAMEPSNARVRKYNNALTQEALVTVGTTPRHCSISTDNTARRLYVANEGSNTVSIVELDANTVVASPTVCDTVAGRKIDTKRLQNTTNTFITCNSNVNSVVIDDTVSEFGVGGSPIVCIDTNLDGLTDLCFTDTNGDGIADNGQLGALGAYRSNANLTQFGTDVFCAFGISTQACTNKDIKTNGVGLTYLMILVIWSYAFLVGTHIFAVKKIQKENIQVMDAIKINPVLLLAMLVIDIGIAFFLSWIPNIIFYTILVILIGLAGFGIYRQVKGGE